MEELSLLEISKNQYACIILQVAEDLTDLVIRCSGQMSALYTYLVEGMK